MLKNWERLHSMMGANLESQQSLREMLRSTLSILFPDETETKLKSASFELPVPFLNAFLIRVWFATK